MFTQIKKYDQPITLDFAMEVATHPKWKGERDMSKSRVELLRRELDAGRFYSPTWVFAWLGGKKYRVNGQHSSNMLAECGDKMPRGMIATVIEFLCETENDIAELFGTFDRPESARNIRDILGSHAAIHPEISDASPRTIGKATAGVVSALRYTKRLKGAITRDDRARVVHTHTDFISWGSKLLSSRLIEYEAVSAAIFLTYEKSPSQAMKFWTLVLDGSATSNKHPTRVLQIALLNIKATPKTNDSNRMKKWPPRAVTVKCIHACNAYCDGRDISDLKYFADAEFPEIKTPSTRPMLAIA